MNLLSIIDTQPDLTNVLEDVDEAKIVSEQVWISCYSQQNSIHSKFNVILDELDRNQINITSSSSLDDVELVKVSDNTFKVSCHSLHIPPTTVLYPVQQYSNSQPHKITTFDLSPDSTQFALGHLDGSVYLYPSSPLHRTKYIPHLVTPLNPQRAKPHLSAVSSLRFFPSSRVLLTAGIDFSLSILPAELSETTTRLAPVRTLRSHKRAITATGIIPPGKTILSSSLDSTVKVWDVSSGEATSTLLAASPIQSMAVQDDNTVICGLSSGQFESFDLRTGSSTYRSTSSPSSASLSAISISSSSQNWFATGSVKGVVTVYDLRFLSSSALATFCRNEAGIEDMSFIDSVGLVIGTSDGLPFVAGLDGEMNVKVVAELAGVNCDAIRGVKTRGREVWCASDDGVVRKWVL